MKEITFKSIEEFCEELNDTIIDLDGTDKYTEVVANYKDAKEILKELVYYDYDIDFIELSNPDWDEYCDAFSISVIGGKICCEKSKRGNSYPFSGAQVVYFMEDVNNNNTKAYENTAVKYCVFIEDEDDADFDYGELYCDQCTSVKEKREDNKQDNKQDKTYAKIYKDDDGIHGFTLSFTSDDRYISCNFYSSDKFSDDMLKSLKNIFDV